MFKYPHTLHKHKAEIGDLITYYCKVTVNKITYVTEISYHENCDKAFSILRVLRNSKMSLLKDIYRINRLIAMEDLNIDDIPSSPSENLKEKNMTSADPVELIENTWTEGQIRSFNTDILEQLSENIQEAGFETMATSGRDDPEAMLFIDELQKIQKIVDDELKRREQCYQEN